MVGNATLWGLSVLNRRDTMLILKCALLGFAIGAIVSYAGIPFNTLEWAAWCIGGNIFGQILLGIK